MGACHLIEKFAKCDLLSDKPCIVHPANFEFSIKNFIHTSGIPRLLHKCITVT